MNPGQAIKILKEFANLPEFEKVTNLSKRKNNGWMTMNLYLVLWLLH